jgi:hypothetical protein
MSSAELQDYAGSAKILLMTLPDVIDALDVPKKENMSFSNVPRSVEHRHRHRRGRPFVARTRCVRRRHGRDVAGSSAARPSFSRHLARDVRRSGPSQKICLKKGAQFPSFQEMSAHAADVLSKTLLVSSKKGGMRYPAWSSLPRPGSMATR